jgi:hypothetical protein
LIQIQTRYPPCSPAASDLPDCAAPAPLLPRPSAIRLILTEVRFRDLLEQPQGLSFRIACDPNTRELQEGDYDDSAK